jgi:dethiobiotin synthetase
MPADEGPAAGSAAPIGAAVPVGAGIRPGRLVVVAGTGTEVGKTWVAAAVLRHLVAAGHRVAARKPAQSFGSADPAASTDAAVLGTVTGEAPTTVCPPPRWYPVAMAPPMAADVLGRPPFTVADLVAETRWPAGTAVGLVEMAGGVRSPQAADGDAVVLGRLLGSDLVVLVAGAGLGTINDVRLAVDALTAPTGVPAPVVVVLNRFDPADDLHRRNRDWLVDRDGMAVVTTPGGEEALAGWALGG